MEIKFKKGDSVVIPEGCKAVVSNGVVAFEKKEPKFKAGDILIDDFTFPWFSNKITMIYKGEKTDNVGFMCYAKMSGSGDLYIGDSYSNLKFCEIRHATEEEKQRLFDKMKEQGLRWNAEEKKVEEIKWQPQNGERYFFVNAYCETGSIICLENYIEELLEKACNQLRTKELAEKAAEAVRETLRRFHEENKIE